MNGTNAYTVNLISQSNSSEDAGTSGSTSSSIGNLTSNITSSISTSTNNISNAPINAETLTNQSSPAWVLTFVRFENRDTFRNDESEALETRDNDPLVVENDCISVTTSMNKGTLTPSMEAILKETDVNYLTAVAPGDFVFVNMLNWEEDARVVAKNARNKFSINGLDDGFKGIFKIQSVRKNIAVNEQTGDKSVTYKIDGYGFTEFNNILYFDQNLLASGAQDNFSLFISNLSGDWKNLVNKLGFSSLRDIVKLLIRSFVGAGIDNTTYGSNSFLPTPNTHFQIPGLVGSLLNIPKAKSAKDIYNYIFGIQDYSSGTSSALSMAKGLSPSLTTPFVGPGFNYTPTDLGGGSLLNPEYWNCVKAWSIINQYTNTPLNEIYTCYRLAPDNNIYPTIVFRQIPFTTQDFEERMGVNPPNTKFLSIPRWKIDSSLVYSLDIGRDEAARVNFYQYFSRIAVNDSSGSGPAQEVSQGNYTFDLGDVTRSGLRPSIVNNNFDPAVNGPITLSPVWVKIMADSTFGSQLKLNGTIEMVGVIQPICVGDNLQFDGIVFHIESVIHTSNIDPASGIKRFKTILKLSSGISITSTSSVTKYSQMTNTNAYQDRISDNKHDQILPGVSESQDILERPLNVDITSLASEVNSPFPQPTKP